MKYKMIMGLWALVASLLLNQEAGANNIVVTNVSLSGGDGYVNVRCDISWDNSWRATWVEGVNNMITNWDAAWVFVKFRYGGGDWLHASLATNDSDHSVPAGSTLDVGLTDTKGMGVFFYRSEAGAGSWTNTVFLRWNYAQDGLASTAIVDVCVHAIEMVYVAQGDFAAGSGGSEDAGFTLTTINTPNATTAPSGSGSLGGQAGGYPTGQTAPNAAWPNGWNAFYCMKYEISEGQWVDFFNTLKSGQKTTRDITGAHATYGGKNSDGVVSRNTVAWTSGDATSTARDRACCYLCWADMCAYADWAGLRPMTELEFEKACRGVAAPVANEYAWGNTIISATTAIVNDGTGQDTATGGNCNYGGSSDGPYRCGIYATTNSTREAAGASYWGIMDLSGNLLERTVTIGDADGRAFTGLHGNGVLTGGEGEADVSLWPALATANGAGSRGGDWSSTTAARVSDRVSIAYAYADRLHGFYFHAFGGRAVRLAP